ncbi:MAG: type II CAAX endopeptidase family protein [Cyanobacteriota bacterium]
MMHQDIVKLAKQGNPKAIAALINRSLASQGITAKALLRNGCLYLLLESAQLPEQQSLVPFLGKKIKGLATPSIKTVKVYGRQLGTDSPAWRQKIDLRLNAASPSESVPSDTELRSKIVVETDAGTGGHGDAPEMNLLRMNATEYEQTTLQPSLPSSTINPSPTKAVTTSTTVSIRQAEIVKNPFLNLQARGFFLGVFILPSLIGIVISLSESISGLTLEEPLVASIIYITLFSCLCLWALRHFKRLQIPPRRIIGKLPSHYNWLPAIGLVIAILLFSLGSFYLSYYFLSFREPALTESLLTKQLFLSTSETPAALFYNCLKVFVLVVVAPVAEEFLFRGVILHRWTAKWGIKPALLVSSLIFGLLHDNVVGLSIFGLVMALLYIKTRTLIVPIVCHVLNNAIVVILGFLTITFNSTQTTYTLEQFRSDWWIGIVLLGLSAPWLIHFIYKNWPNSSSSIPYFANTLNPCDRQQEKVIS